MCCDFQEEEEPIVPEIIEPPKSAPPPKPKEEPKPKPEPKKPETLKGMKGIVRINVLARQRQPGTIGTDVACVYFKCDVSHMYLICSYLSVVHVC